MTIGILDWLLCIFRLYMLWDMERNMLPMRYVETKKKFLFNLILVCLLWSVNYIWNSYINLIVIPVIYVIFSYIFFHGELIKKVIISYFYYLLAIAPEFIFAVFISWDSSIDYNALQKNSIGRWVMTLLLKTITFFLVKCINYLHKNKNYSEIKNKVFGSLFILPVATIVLFISFYYADVQTTGVIKNMLILGSILLVFANAFTFYQFDRFIEKEEKRRELELLYKKSELQNQSLHYIEEINEQHNLLLHDIHKYVRTAGALLDEENDEEVLLLLSQLSGKLLSSKKNKYCEHKILNAIIGERELEASRYRISFQVNIEQNVMLDFIEEIDLISIIGNLLDNAIEASKYLADRGKIRVHIYKTDHFVAIEIENNYFYSPVRGDKGYVTSKREKEKHGIGLTVVGQIVEKYNGVFQVDHDNNLFQVSILLGKR